MPTQPCWLSNASSPLSCGGKLRSAVNLPRPDPPATASGPPEAADRDAEALAAPAQDALAKAPAAPAQDGEQEALAEAAAQAPAVPAQDGEAAGAATQEALVPPPASGPEHFPGAPTLDAEPEVHPSQQSTVAGDPFRLPAAEVDETLADLMALGEGGRNASTGLLSGGGSPPDSIRDTFLDPPVTPGEECEEAARSCAAADTASGLVDSNASSSAFGQHGAAAIVSPRVAASPPAARQPTPRQSPRLSATAIKSGQPSRPSTIAADVPPAKRSRVGAPIVDAFADTLPLGPPSPKQPRLEPAASASEAASASGQVSTPSAVARRPAASDKAAKEKEAREAAREAKKKADEEAKAIAKAKNKAKLALYLQVQQVAKAYKVAKAASVAPAPQPQPENP